MLSQYSHLHRGRGSSIYFKHLTRSLTSAYR